MKQFSFFLFVLICLIACNSKPKNNCKPYFEFDELEHYFIEISDDYQLKLMERDSLSEKELRLNDVLIQRKPEQLSDFHVVSDLEAIGFTKKNVGASKFETINEIFCERKHIESVSAACIPIYRDVLIFKRKNKIVGIAKICFGCMHHVIAGANGNTIEFGQSGDYDRLYKLLYQNSMTGD